MELLRGRDGRDGRDGAKGEPGPRGLVGEKGMHGDPGTDGAKGEKGMTGIRGPMGMSGPQGIAGESGQHGQQGLPGPVGEKGMRGDPGLRGPQGEQGVQGPPGGGATYIRWGRTTCPTANGTQLVYSGRAGGTYRLHKGGAANYLCMPDDPDHLQYQSGVQGRSHITGVEYYYNSMPSLSSNNFHNVPCAVCYVATRSVALMITAKTQCPTNWTLEYIGYLMSERRSNGGRTMYECVDKDPESVPGLNAASDPRAFLYIVEPYCNGLSCPPYDAEKELTCAVCTR